MGIHNRFSHGIARRTSATVVAAICVTGCASKSSEPVATDELDQIPISSHSAPLATDGEPQKQRVVIDSVNDTVDRYDQIIKQREQANRNAADLRETREALADREKPGKPADEAAEVEKLAAQLRERKPIDPIPEPPLAVAQPTVQAKPAAPNAAVDASAAVASSANQAIDLAAGSEHGMPTIADPSLDVAGAINSAPNIEMNRGGNPNVSRSSSGDLMLAVQQRLVSRVAEDPRDMAAQLDLQLARFLRDEPVPAMSDLTALPAEDRELLAAVCDALGNFRSVVTADANPLNSAKARPFIDMAERIRARADLTLGGLTLCQRVTSFGVYDKIEPLSFQAEGIKKFVVYCEVDGFLSQLNANSKWETKLSLELKLYDDHNMQVWTLPAKPTSDLSARRRRDFFLVQLVELPAKMPAGHYLLKARVRDLVGNRVAEQTIQFEVRAADGDNIRAAERLLEQSRNEVRTEAPFVTKESVKR